MRRVSVAVVILALAATRGYAQKPSSFPAYKAASSVSGKLTAWGNNDEKKLWDLWRDGFRKHHPGVQFEDTLKSSVAAMGALYTGTANITLFGREVYPMEVLSFQRVHGYEPLGVTVGTGSHTGLTSGIGIWVHKDNPLTKLNMTQVDAIFGHEHRRGARENVRKWGQVGLTGEWADRPINVYGYPVRSMGFPLYFEVATFNGGTKWNPDLRELDSIVGPDGKEIPGGLRITDALAKDRYGIGYAGLAYKNPSVKSLPLASRDGGPYLEGTLENVANRTYPLTRSIYIYVNRNPKTGLDPLVREFLRYVLSQEGQQAVANSGYLPLTGETLRTELAKVR